jgi:hypothetical protein
MADEKAQEKSSEMPEAYWLGPIKSFFLFHILDSGLFWGGIVLICLFQSEVFASHVYTWLSIVPFVAGLFQSIYEWGTTHYLGMLGVLMVLLSISRSYIGLQTTRFVIEDGILIVTRGKFSWNPFCFFQRTDHTVALNLIYDVDVKKTIFQYVFGGGDVFVRTASNDIFHLEFVEDVHKLRAYLLEHSGIKNKPVIGVY